MTKKVNISLPKVGMDKDSHPSLLKESQYTHAKNANVENESGNSLNIKNEKSNILASSIKEGFVVINQTNDIDSDTTYFFLVNPETGVGEFGKIENNQNTNDLEDLTVNCADCREIKELATPLEEINQTSLQEYVTLITDACKDSPSEGFNFDVKNPIKKTVIKNEKCGKTIYFSHKGNPPRHINIDKISDYYIDNIPCDDDVILDCANFELMRVFKKHSIPNLNPVSIELGGNLKKGVYEFLVAYCDASGNEISEYYSITNPISIFDKNNKILAQPNIADRTGFAIKLSLENLDDTYTHFKIAVIQTADIEGATRYFEEGIHPINTKTILYATEQDKIETSIDKLARFFPKVEETEGVATANNILYQYGVTNKKEINLQPVVNLLGSCLKWQTHIAPEDLYENGVAKSLFLGYNRDEIVPFGIKFGLKGGYETANFPFIARPATEDEKTEINSENLDRVSIETNTNDCISSNRTKKWQLYNTSTIDNDFCTGDIETVQIEEIIRRFCIINDIVTIPSGSMVINNTTTYTGLEDYINDNKGTSEAECNNAYTNSTEDICSFLYDDYSLITCNSNPFEGISCDTPTEINSYIEIQDVLGEVVTEIEKTFGEDYTKIVPPQNCILYKTNPSTGTPLVDSSFQDSYQISPIYKREGDFFNESCTYASEITVNQNPLQNLAVGYFNSYSGSDILSNLFTTKTSTLTATGFYNNINKNAIWFKGETEGKERFIIDVSKQKDDTTYSDYFDTKPQTVRLSVFKNCTDTAAIFSEFIDMNQGGIFLLEKSGADLIITDENGTPYTTILSGWFTSGEYFWVVDSAIETITVNVGDEFTPIYESRYITTPTKGCYTITKRDVEIKNRLVEWDSIVLQKKIEYEAICTFNKPVIQPCKAIPYKKGDFAYWESQLTYPDNNSLYNSSNLVIKQTDLPVEAQEIIEQHYATVNLEGVYEWKISEKLDGDILSQAPSVDFTCRNIRHFKFPDNRIAPFMWDSKQPGFVDSAIFPLGVTINEETINAFLNIAENNNLISKKDRADIVSYEITRGDLTLDRSVVASGLLYDTREYEEKGKTKLYSNYPYNSYSPDKFNLSEGGSPLITPNFGIFGKNYTFHSPETDYYKPSLPSEMSIQAYMYGQTRINFNEVEGHSKWVIITEKARELAKLLAILEVTAEAAIAAAQAVSNAQVWFMAGFANGASIGIPAYIASGIILTFQTITASVFKFGRYRYEWLKIFRDLGTPYNFASYIYSVGDYNYLGLYDNPENNVRGLNVVKYLNEGEYIFTNEVNQDRLHINNTNREKSVFISTGDVTIEYPSEYSNYDKDTFTSSLTFLSENGLSESGKSSDVIRNIASPYVFLKNYLPQQHGSINSIRWFTTGYKGDLTNPKTECLSVFGGDTYICRHTLKRKHSQFLINALNQSDRTPFNYYFYNNIGRNPAFYVSYNIDKDFSGGGKLFPDIVDDFVLDNETKSGNYYRPPSKFYLFHYGIPNFLCETRINTNYRYAEKEIERNFYPQVGDVGQWTQEKNVSIREPNYFFYNRSYSKQVTPLKIRTLSETYNEEDNNCKTDFPNGIIASLPDNSENNSYDPWLIYRPLDFYEFRTDYGKLRNITGIENEAILARFDNTSILFNKVDYTNDDGQTPNQVFLGGTATFQRRSASFYNAQLGFGGTQNTAEISCEFGHFHVDSKRGQVIQIPPQGGQMEEISSSIGGKPSGMRQWFKEHLPFKILKYFKDVDIDDSYNGLGITMGWDSRYRRVFITKKDYIPKVEDITHVNGSYFSGEKEIKLTDSNYFLDCSWTIAYSPVLGMWMSFYDFKPNYYINHNTYFQTGINQTEDSTEFGLWSHGLTNKSYNVFYGKKYSFDIEYPIKAEFEVKKLNNVKIWTEAKRYHNEYDWAISPIITFNKTIIHNNISCSGYLNLIPQKNNFVGNKNFPKTNSDGTQDILITNKDNYKWTYDYFFDRVLNNVSNTPFINYDKNQIEKTINTNIVKFSGKKVLERIKGDWFLNRLSYDKDSRYSLTLKFTLNETDTQV